MGIDSFTLLIDCNKPPCHYNYGRWSSPPTTSFIQWLVIDVSSEVHGEKTMVMKSKKLRKYRMMHHSLGLPSLYSSPLVDRYPSCSLLQQYLDIYINFWNNIFISRECHGKSIRLLHHSHTWLYYMTWLIWLYPFIYNMIQIIQRVNMKTLDNCVLTSFCFLPFYLFYIPILKKWPLAVVDLHH